jgi:hypothetical protein
MVDSLDEEMHRRIQAECDAFSATRHLDSEIQRELRAHMEDKVLAYLNGEEALTFDDALILARAHFGDPAVLKGLMCGVHPVEVRDNLARRLAAAMFAGTLLSIVFMFTQRYAVWVFAWFGIPVLPQIYLQMGGSLLTLWVCLYYWQGRLRAGHPPWFATWSAFRIASCLAIVFLFKWALELRSAYSQLAVLSDAKPAATFESMGGWPTVYLFLGFKYVYLLMFCLIWLWWCDRPPRLWQNLVTTVLVWTVYEGLIHGLGPVFEMVYARDIAMSRGTPVLHQGIGRYQYVLALFAAGALTSLLGYVAVSGITQAWRGRQGTRFPSMETR